MTPRVANLLTTAGLAGLFAGVTFTAPRWAGHFREPVAAEEEPRAGLAGGVVSATPSPPEAPPEAQRTINVKLFFEASDRRGLVLEDRAVPYFAELSHQIRSVVEELIKGSQQGFVAPLNPETRVLEVFVTARGVAYVDLSKEVGVAPLAGSESELLTVYAVVNSVVENFPAVRRVQILVDDHPAETLSGHVDVSRPLSPDLTLLAAAAVTPVESRAPEGAQGPAPSPPS
jgi:hypothetical protein